MAATLLNIHGGCRHFSITNIGVAMWAVAGLHGCATPTSHDPEIRRSTITHQVSGEQTDHAIEYLIETRATGPRNEEPITTLTGEYQSGAVSTRVYDRRYINNDRDSFFAQLISQSANAAVALIWPDYDLQAHIDIRLLTGGEGVAARYGFSRDIGGIWNLPLHMRRVDGPDEGALGRQAEVPVHELYHLLAIENGFGLHGDNPVDNPLLGLIWEETAARLFASCGLLQANGTAARFVIHSAEITNEDGTTRTITAPLDDPTLAEILDRIEHANTSDGAVVSPEISNLLDLTIWSEISGGDYVIDAGTPQAQALLDTCQRVGPDPFELAPLLRQLSRDGRNQELDVVRDTTNNQIENDSYR